MNNTFTRFVVFVGAAFAVGMMIYLIPALIFTLPVAPVMSV